jgi:trimethylamine---corrinoid protein Co-methyltransferase
MYDRMQSLSKENLTMIHASSMKVLEQTGVVFNDTGALQLFKDNGFKIDGKKVFFNENNVLTALDTTPSSFELQARNPKKNVFIGEDSWVYVPTYGAPFIISREGVQHPGTMHDYDSICKLVQTSEHINMNGFKHVEPSDVITETAYLDMLFSNITLCDKPFMGSTDTIKAAKDSIEMAGIVFNGQEQLKEKPVIVGLINPLSPLQFAEEMAGSILVYARHRQPIIIANMIMAGTSGPISLPGLLTLMNVEILAGLTLAQLAGPGTPVIYGSTSCPMNMQTGAATIGSPETYIINSATAQLARYYNLPCRTGGSLTDSLIPDAQALAEGALSLSTSVSAGANIILHSCGMIGTYIGVNLEKWIIDEELCGMVRSMMTPMEINEKSINLEAITSIGAGGNYLTHPSTLANCRTAFYDNNLYNKSDHFKWSAAGSKRIDEVAADTLFKRLSEYEKPPIDPSVETALSDFITKAKGVSRGKV